MLRYVGEEENQTNNENDYDRRDSSTYDDGLLRGISWYHKLLLNRPIKVILLAFIITVILPPMLYFFMFIAKADYPIDEYSIGTCAHGRQHRIQCGLDYTNETECPTNCCFDYEHLRCYHKLPSRYTYLLHEEGESRLMPRFLETPYRSASNLPHLKLRISEISEDHLNIVIYDETIHSFDAPERVSANKNYRYKSYKPEFFFNVFSTNSDDPLLTTTRGPLIASENIWEWTVLLSEGFNYGLDALPIENGTRKILYNTPDRKALLPVITAIKNGSFHALVIEHSGPLELNFMESNLITMKSILGQSLSLHVVMGPKPKDITRQIQEYFGQPLEIEYWMLGAHFCRSNMTSTVEDALELEKMFREEMLTFGIPYESDCIDADLVSMLNSPALTDNMDSIQNATNEIRESSKRFLASLAPYMLADENSTVYQAALLSDILVLAPDATSKPNKDNITYLGLIDDVEVAYIDYYNPGVLDFIRSYWSIENLTDGFYLRDNWPLNYGLQEEHRNYEFPYFTDEFYDAFNLTLPWNAIHQGTFDGSNLHMAHHNSYGKAQSRIIQELVETPEYPQESTLIFTSSTALGDKSIYAWQNVEPLWTTFKESFVSAALGSLTGSIQAPPVCGDSYTFNNMTDEHLCLKWYLASTFLPIFRVHSNNYDRDPLVFKGNVRNAMANAIRNRYKLLPYYYSVLANSEPLLRPLFYDFHEDIRTLDNDRQFMVGEALMIAPNFVPRQITMNVLLPLDETWYEFWDGNLINGTENEFVIVPTTETDIPIFIRAGYIIPTHEIIYDNADATRQQSKYTLIIALKCADDECQASGNIRMSKKEYIEMTANTSNVTLSLHSSDAELSFCDNEDEMDEISSIINSLKVYGLKEEIHNFDFFYYKTNLNVSICDAPDNGALTIDYY